MSEDKLKAQSDAQAGSSGEAAGVGSAVGGVRSSNEHNWLDLWALNPETRAYLRAARRDAACSHASSRREGAGDGSQEIATPEKLRHLQDTLYRKAKAQPDYRFWSLYGELTRRDLLEHALRLVVRNGKPTRTNGCTASMACGRCRHGWSENRRGTHRMPRNEATRKAGYGKPVRPV